MSEPELKAAEFLLKCMSEKDRNLLVANFDGELKVETIDNAILSAKPPKRHLDGWTQGCMIVTIKIDWGMALVAEPASSHAL